MQAASDTRAAHPCDRRRLEALPMITARRRLQGPCTPYAWWGYAEVAISQAFSECFPDSQPSALSPDQIGSAEMRTGPATSAHSDSDQHCARVCPHLGIYFPDPRGCRSVRGGAQRKRARGERRFLSRRWFPPAALLFALLFPPGPESCLEHLNNPPSSPYTGVSFSFLRSNAPRLAHPLGRSPAPPTPTRSR